MLSRISDGRKPMSKHHLKIWSSAALQRGQRTLSRFSSCFDRRCFDVLIRDDDSQQLSAQAEETPFSSDHAVGLKCDETGVLPGRDPLSGGFPKEAGDPHRDQTERSGSLRYESHPAATSRGPLIPRALPISGSRSRARDEAQSATTRGHMTGRAPRAHARPLRGWTGPFLTGLGLPCREIVDPTAASHYAPGESQWQASADGAPCSAIWECCRRCGTHMRAKSPCVSPLIARPFPSKISCVNRTPS